MTYFTIFHYTSKANNSRKIKINFFDSHLEFKFIEGYQVKTKSGNSKEHIELERGGDAKHVIIRKSVIKWRCTAKQEPRIIKYIK